MKAQLEARVTAVRKKLSSLLGLPFSEWEDEAQQKEDQEVSAKDKLRFLEITKSLRIAMHRHATLRYVPPPSPSSRCGVVS